MSSQWISVPFVGGLDERTALQYLDPQSKQTVVVNGQFVRLGALDQRLGLESLPKTIVSGSFSEPAQGLRVTDWSRSGLTALGSGVLYTYSEANRGLVGVASVPDVKVTRKPLVTSPTATRPVITDVTTTDGRLLRVSTYNDDARNVLATVHDVESGDVLVQPSVIYVNDGNTTSFPQTVCQFELPTSSSMDNRVKIFIQDLWYFRFEVVSFNPDTLQFSAPSALANQSFSYVTLSPWYFGPFYGSSGYMFVHGQSSKTTVRVRHYDENDGVLATTDIPVPGGHELDFPLTANFFYSAGNSEKGWVAFTTVNLATFQGQVQLCRLSSEGSFTLETGPTQISTPSFLGWRPSCMARVGVGQVHFVKERHVTPTFTSNYLETRISEWETWEASGGTDTRVGVGPNPIGWLPSGATFMRGGRLYGYFIYDPITAFGPYTSATRMSLQTSAMLCEYKQWLGTWTGGSGTSVLRVVGRTASRLLDPVGYTGLIYGSGAIQFMSTAYYDRDRYGVGVKVRGLQVAASRGFIGGGAYQSDFLFGDSDRQDLYQTAELGSELHMSSGVPFVSDGSTAFEQGFEHYPEFAIPRLNVSSSGVTLPAGQYSYAVDYEWTDGAGLVHRSAPYFTVPFSVPGTGQGCQLWIPPYSVTYRDGPVEQGVDLPVTPVYANVYRTVQNGSTYYFIDRIQVSANCSEVVLWPDPATASADNVQNNVAQLSTTVYTTGGSQLEEVCVPGTNLLRAHGNRVAQVDETYLTVWFSKEFEEGFAPGYHESLSVTFPEGGPITAIESMDQYFVAFKETSIWQIYGNGPLENGQGEPWPVPSPVTTDVGVKNWQSVVKFPDGIMFRSSNGFHVLRRNLQVEYVGEAVQNTLASYPNVTSATLVPDRTEIRFSCVNDAGDDSVVIVYDYHHRYWYTFDYARLPSPIVSGSLTGNPRRYTVMCQDATMFREKLPDHATAYKDEDAAGTAYFVPMRVRTAPIKLDVQGYHRMRRVMLYGERLGYCGVKMSLFVNNVDTPVFTKSFRPDQIDANRPIKGQVRMGVGKLWTRAIAHQIEFETSDGGDSQGRSMRFVNATFEVEQLMARRPLGPTGQR